MIMSQADTPVHLLVSFLAPPCISSHCRSASQHHLRHFKNLFWCWVPVSCITHLLRITLLFSKHTSWEICNHSFIQHIFNQHILWNLQCFGPWEYIREQSRGSLASLRTLYSCECACVHVCVCVCVCVCRVTRSITGCSVSFEFQINHNTF